MTRHPAPVTYVNGDRYTFDRASGEWIESHHGHDADAVRAFVDERTEWRRG